MGEAVENLIAKVSPGEHLLSAAHVREHGESALVALASKSASISQEQRDEWARTGVAMSDGSFPIPDADFLQRAITSLGRGNKSSESVKAHIKKRAKALGLTSKLPEDWQ